MAADRSRLAAALAYKQAEEERRQRMMQSVPTTDNLPPVQPTRRSLRTNLENLSSGIGQGIVNQLEGVKALVTDPVGTAKAAYEGFKGVVRDPTVLADALRYTADKATSGPLGAGEVIGEMIGPMRGKPLMAEIDVYHGSPHRFEEFDASKIGTGEGAQAYGHGIYLAENPEIAKGYRDRLQRQGKMDSTGQLDLMMEKSLPKVQGGYEIKGVIYPYHKDLIEGISQGLIKKGDIPDDLYNVAKSYTEPGALYTADLPDEMVDRMLDWDKPLLEQSPAVRKALRDAKFTQVADEIESSYLESLPPEARALALKMINGPYEEVISHDGRRKGKNLIAAKNWDDLERLAPGIEHNEIFRIRNWHASKNAPDFYAELSRVSDKESSERLRQAGVPGIKYLDAGSRGQGGSGTRNFVVFPGEEKKVKILRRE
jgi:hypothetical protein